MCARESALWVIDETLVLIAIIVAKCQPLRAIPQGDLSDEALHSLPRAVAFWWFCHICSNGRADFEFG